VNGEKKEAIGLWAELVRDAGVLWLTFGLLEALRDDKVPAWCGYWWYPLTIAVGVGLMAVGVMMDRWG
jgi:hypothetical protein